MSEQNAESTGNAQSDTVKRLFASLKIPVKKSTDFIAPSSSRSHRPTMQFRAIAPAPPTNPAPAPLVTQAVAPKIPKSRKRKAGADADGTVPAKKKKKKKTGPTAKASAGTGPTSKKLKAKPDATTMIKKKTPTLPPEIWLRVAEFCPPKMLKTLRLVYKGINNAFLEWPKQVYSAQVTETFPAGMPTGLGPLTSKEFNNLLGAGKGCLAPGCKDKNAEKTYWPFLRRWCAECWKDRTVKERTLQHLDGYDIPTTRLLKCVPYGVCDSYGKATQTVADLPLNNNPKQHKLYERAAYEKVKKVWLDFMPGPYIRDSKATDAEDRVARAAYEASLKEKKEVREAHFKDLEEENEKFMNQVIKVEDCIKAAKKGSKDQKKLVREQRKQFVLDKVAADLPHIPVDSIKDLKCFKDVVRNCLKEAGDKVWLNLKPKLIQQLADRENVVANEASSNVASITSTRDSTPASISPVSVSEHQDDLTLPPIRSHTPPPPMSYGANTSASSAATPSYGSSQPANNSPYKQVAPTNHVILPPFQDVMRANSSVQAYLPQDYSNGRPHIAQSQPLLPLIFGTPAASRSDFGSQPTTSNPHLRATLSPAATCEPASIFGTWGFGSQPAAQSQPTPSDSLLRALMSQPDTSEQANRVYQHGLAIYQTMPIPRRSTIFSQPAHQAGQNQETINNANGVGQI